MYPGKSNPNANEPILTVEPDGNGLKVEVPQTTQSRSIFLLSANQRFQLKNYGYLNATVTFQLPQVSGGSPNDPWSVGLVLKSGSQNETNDVNNPDKVHKPDQAVAITCQFTNGGNIKFHGTQTQPIIPVKTYADFATRVIHLSIEIWRRNLAGIVGTTGDLPHTTGKGTIQFDDGSNYHYTDFLSMKDIPTQVVHTDIDFVTAIGVSVVNLNNKFNYVSANLLSFFLYIGS
jgi:hypothetical protein